MKVAVISDTHGYFDPQLALLLRGTDEVLHTGDVGSEGVLDQLRAIGPVHAVRGNIDSPASGLPLTLARTYSGIHICMVHELPEGQATLQERASLAGRGGKPTEPCRRFLESFPKECRVVVFGHSHEPCALLLGDKLFFNPGSAGKKRFSLPRCCGLLEISPEGVKGTFLGLERYNQGLPEAVWMPSGGVTAC